jgi:hypothetical protein
VRHRTKRKRGGSGDNRDDEGGDQEPMTGSVDPVTIRMARLGDG